MAPSRAGGESVAIVGAGLGGLALAQSLASRGVPCRVLERDASLDAPGRRVRIHCRPTVLEALGACLPGWVLEALLAAQGAPDERHVVLDGDLNVLEVDERPEPEVTLDTATTREVLALGLGSRLELGREVTSVRRTSASRLSVGLADGTAVDAAVVVGADGAESTVRGFADASPHLRDVRVWSVYGTVDLDADDNAELELPPWLRDAFALVVAGDVKVALGVYEPRGLSRLRGQAGASLSAVQTRRYLFWNVIASPETLRTAEIQATKAPARALDEVALLVGRISPWLRGVVLRSAPRTVGRLRLQTSSRGRGGDGPGAVALVGDAAHPMLPAALSASVAVEDARRLGHALSDGDLGATLPERAASVADELLDAAFAKVREAELIAGPAFGFTGAAR